MNTDNNILTSVFYGATETRSLEFKEGFNWEAQVSAKLKDELIKAILSMSNTPGGGAIILGINRYKNEENISRRSFSKGCPKFYEKS